MVNNLVGIGLNVSVKNGDKGIISGTESYDNPPLSPMSGVIDFDNLKLSQRTSVGYKEAAINPEVEDGMETLYVALFARGTNFNKIDGYPAIVQIFNFKANRAQQSLADYIPALDSSGTPCMFDLVTRAPFQNEGSGQFIVGIKNTAQLRTVLRKLPDRTEQEIGTLTLSIPDEANTPEMQELLDATEAQKNWELTIQERAAEVATYSLRRVRKVVWVRRVPDKNGSYVDASGLRWRAEWCSAIYSPLGNDPTLHGYEPFDSVEQAVEAWGLVPYEEEDLDE